MLASLTKNRWMLLLRGVLAIIFGILTLLNPDTTFKVLVLLFGAYALVDGVFAIITAISGRAGNQRWWLLLLEGLFGILAGIITFADPVGMGLTMVAVIGIWAIVTGVMQIMEAIRLRQEIDNEWLLGLAGLLSVIAGILLVALPTLGALSLLTLIGVYSIIFGILFIGLALRLGKLQPPTSPTPSTPA